MRPKLRIYFSLIALFSVLPLVGSALLFYIVSHMQVEQGQDSLVVLLVFYVVMIFTMAFALTPTTFVAFVSGYLFSWWGFGMMVAAYFFASMIGEKAGRLFSGNVLNMITERNEKWKRFVQRTEGRMFPLVFFSRLSPVMPFAMVNVALSSFKISRRDFFIGTLSGMMPRTFLFFWAGKHAISLLEFFEHPSGEGAWKLFPFFLIFVSLAGLLFYVKRILKDV